MKARLHLTKCVGRIIAIKTERTPFSFEATLSLPSRHRIVKSLIIMMIIIIIKIIVIMIIMIIITVYSQLFYLVAIQLKCFCMYGLNAF